MLPSVTQTPDVLQVTFVEIDEEGKVTKRFPRIDAEGQLKNTVLHKRYPEILVARCQRTQAPTGRVRGSQGPGSAHAPADDGRSSIVSSAPAARPKTASFMPLTLSTKS